MNVPAMLAALSLRRRPAGGGGVVPVAGPEPVACPEVGSGTGQLVFYADQVFTSAYSAVPDWSGTLGAEDAFGAPDSIGWLWVATDGFQSGVMSGIRFQAEPGWLACPNMTITGGNMEAFYFDAVDATVAAGMVDNALTDGAFGTPTAVSGAGSIGLTFNAAQAAGLLDGSYQSFIIFDPSSETAQISWDAVRWTINYTA